MDAFNSSSLISWHTSSDQAHVLYAILGALVVVFGLVSLVIKDKLYLSDALVATILGVIIGPACANVFVPETLFGSSLDDVTLELSRIVIGIQVMAAGVSLPGDYLWRERKPLMWLLGPIMLIKWLISAGGMVAICGIPFIEALVCSACLTPTDPVLCNSIVKGRFAEMRVTLSVRLLLSAESGANDGLGYPFLFLPIFIMKYTNAGEAIGQWLGRVILYQIVLSVIVGIVVGTVARKALKLATLKGWIDKDSFLAYSIGIAVFLMGTLSIAGCDDILACFIVGNVLTWDQWLNQRIAESGFQEAIDYLFNMTFFVYVGARVPWDAYVEFWQISYWRMVLLCVWILILSRPPVLMLFSKVIPTLKTSLEAFFAGFFGPMGASAIFYAEVARLYLGPERIPYLFAMVYFVVLSSILVHGVSVPFFHIGLTRADTYASWKQGRRFPMPSFDIYMPPFLAPLALLISPGNSSGSSGEGDLRHLPMFEDDHFKNVANGIEPSNYIDTNENGQRNSFVNVEAPPPPSPPKSPKEDRRVMLLDPTADSFSPSINQATPSKLMINRSSSPRPSSLKSPPEIGLSPLPASKQSSQV